PHSPPGFVRLAKSFPGRLSLEEFREHSFQSEDYSRRPKSGRLPGFRRAISAGRNPLRVMPGDRCRRVKAAASFRLPNLSGAFVEAGPPRFLDAHRIIPVERESLQCPRAALRSAFLTNATHRLRNEPLVQSSLGVVRTLRLTH